MMRVSSGTCEFVVDAVQKVTSVQHSYISWTAEIPDKTSLKVLAKLSDGEYFECVDGNPLPCMNVGDDLSKDILYIKIEMSTDDPEVTPILEELQIQIYDILDKKVITLVFEPGVNNSIQRAAGDITVSYDGSGSLTGQGGPVLAFEKTFTPVNLDPKNNPHDVERISLDLTVNGSLLEIRYIDTYITERIGISDISVVGALIAIDDI